MSQNSFQHAAPGRPFVPAAQPRPDVQSVAKARVPAWVTERIAPDEPLQPRICDPDGPIDATTVSWDLVCDSGQWGVGCIIPRWRLQEFVDNEMQRGEVTILRESKLGKGLQVFRNHYVCRRGQMRAKQRARSDVCPVERTACSGPCAGQQVAATKRRSRTEAQQSCKDGCVYDFMATCYGRYDRFVALKKAIPKDVAWGRDGRASAEAYRQLQRCFKHVRADGHAAHPHSEIDERVSLECREWVKERLLSLVSPTLIISGAYSGHWCIQLCVLSLPSPSGLVIPSLHLPPRIC